MKYAFKLIRNTKTAEVQISQVEAVPSRTAPYCHRRTGYVEALKVYPTKAAALAARSDEELVLRFAALTESERYAEFKRLLKEIKLPQTVIAGVAKISYLTIRGIIRRQVPPPPRLVAKLAKLAAMLVPVWAAAPALLEDDATGNAAKGRGGRPDIWRSNKGRAQK